jgi:hypothetical protein
MVMNGELLTCGDGDTEDADFRGPHRIGGKGFAVPAFSGSGQFLHHKPRFSGACAAAEGKEEKTCENKGKETDFHGCCVLCEKIKNAAKRFPSIRRRTAYGKRRC